MNIAEFTVTHWSRASTKQQSRVVRLPDFRMWKISSVCTRWMPVGSRLLEIVKQIGDIEDDHRSRIDRQLRCRLRWRLRGRRRQGETGQHVLRLPQQGGFRFGNMA